MLRENHSSHYGEFLDPVRYSRVELDGSGNVGEWSDRAELKFALMRLFYNPLRCAFGLDFRFRPKADIRPWGSLPVALAAIVSKLRPGIHCLPRPLLLLL